MVSKVTSITNLFIEPEWDDVSDDAKDLVKKLLTYDPAKRISAADALQHRWIKTQSSHEKVEKTVAAKTLSNLRNFRVSQFKHLTYV
jgi:calcium-dependent protein kinase